MKQVAPRGSASEHSAGRARARRLAPLGLLAAGAVLAGCEADSWFFAPNVVGRWENTPTTVPILERIEVIEPDSGEYVEVSEVLPEDLIPEPLEYRVSPGDFLILEIFDIVVPGAPTRYERSVDPRGTINIPQLGPVYVEGMTGPEVQETLVRLIAEAELVRANPLVTVQVPGQRQSTFSVYGAIPQAARYGIPYPDYRLIEALTDAGGISPVIRSVYVIRQVPLSESFQRGQRPPAGATPAAPGPRPTPAAPEGPGGAESLIDLIEELSAPQDQPTDPPPAVISPGVMGTAEPLAAPGPSPAVFADGDEPLIDLPDATPSRAAAPIPVVDPASAPDPSDPSRRGSGRWVFLDGRWVQVFPTAAPAPSSGLPEGPDPLDEATASDDLVTQRVIEVPVSPLLQGVARYNIVVRPGDLIHVPPPPVGVVYAGGPGITRAGTYNLPATGRLTIQRLVFAAGGLSQIAIPERVDLTRMVGENAQATVRLNVQAIFEGTHPDIYLKPDDLINFGTNFWATPMAIIRNGFRMSYGFGFLLDRNFGNDVFGAPPSNVGGR